MQVDDGSNDKAPKSAIFLTKNNVSVSTIPAIGAKFKVNLKAIHNKSMLSSAVSYIAITVFKHGDIMVRTKSSLQPPLISLFLTESLSNYLDWVTGPLRSLVF